MKVGLLFWGLPKLRKLIIEKVEKVDFFDKRVALKIPGNSWKELRDLDGKGILRIFAEKRWKGTVLPEMSGWWQRRL